MLYRHLKWRIIDTVTREGEHIARCVVCRLQVVVCDKFLSWRRRHPVVTLVLRPPPEIVVWRSTSSCQCKCRPPVIVYGAVVDRRPPAASASNAERGFSSPGMMREQSTDV